jgi:hypothetical protein
LYICISKYSFDITPNGEEHESMDSGRKRRTFNQVSSEISTIGENERMQLTCDDILCLYLRDYSTKTSPTFYRQLVRFVLMYRDCLNEYGWQKKAEYMCRMEKVSEEEKNVRDKMMGFKDEMNLGEFC